MSNIFNANEQLQQALQACLSVFNVPLNQLDELRTANDTLDPFAWTSVKWQMQGLQDSLGTQLAMLFALAGLATLLSLVTLAIQYRARNAEPKVFWLFRRHYHTQSRIPYIVPHPVNVAVLATFITSCLLLLYLGFTYAAWETGKNALAIRVASWFPVVWLPFFAAIWMSGFGSMYLTYLAPAQYTRRGSLTGVKRRVSPVLINTLCFAIPAFAIATILPLQFYQAHYMRLAMRQTKRLTASLNTLSLTWQAQDGQVDQSGVVALLDEALRAVVAVSDWRKLWAGELGLWSSLTILTMGVAAPLCTVLVMSMHRRIRRMAANHVQQNCLVDEVALPRERQDSDDSSKQPITIRISPQGSITDISNYSSSPSDVRYLSFADYTPTPSTPTSTPQTPAARSFASQPFFTSHSSAKLPSLDSWPKETRRPEPASRPSLHNIRRISHYAIYPGASSDLNPEKQADLQELNKRYWHVAAQYLTVFCVMAVISAFALYEASSDLTILTDCRRTNISVMVVSYFYCIAVSLWLSLTIKRLVSQKANNKVESPQTTLESPARSRNVSHQEDLAAYTSDKLGFASPDVIQLRKPSMSSGPPMAGGLRIEIDQSNRAISRAVYETGRRRSSYRGPSMDLTEALSLF